jgi:hypothetical protein
MDFKSFFTKGKEEACEVSASKLFDLKTPMMVKQMERAGDDAETIKAAVVEEKEKYVAKVCKAPKM